MAFYIIIHTFGLIVTTISSVEPPNSADATTDSDVDKMLSTHYILEKNELSNFDYDLIIYFCTVCPQQLTEPQDNSPTVYSIVLQLSEETNTFHVSFLEPLAQQKKYL